MAATSATTFYQSTTDREDLTDMIGIVSADSTPILARIGKKNATNTTHSWSIYARGAAAVATGVEGAAVTFASSTLPTKVSNYCSLAIRPFAVSSSQEASNLAGAGSTFGFLAKEKTIQISKDIEVTIVQSTSATGADGTARTGSGLFEAVSSNLSTAAAVRDFDRTIHMALMKTISDAGGNPNLIVAKNAVAIDIANWPNLIGGGAAQISGASAVGGNNAAMVMLDPVKGVLYDGMWKRISDPWGERDIVYDIVGIPTATASGGAYYLETAQLALAVLDGLHLENAAKVGPAKRAWLQTEFCLEWGQETGHGSVRQISNT